ncbi:MAG: 6-bladed beta-propeller [Gammaproteobacteria bacterium]|nr:6-bladed beta-propeller [Gammaproteobacteria bacterium]
MLALGGCAEPEPKVMRLATGDDAEGRPILWPSLPETPRYAYVGELTGEPNFEPVKGPGERSTAVRVLSWLAGLGLDEPRPLVLQRPQSGVTDRTGRILVTDVSHRAVFVFDPVDARLEVWASAADATPFEAPIGIVATDEGFLVTDAELGAVFRLGHDGRPLGQFGGDALIRPTGITRDTAGGRIFVADTRANDIKIFDDAGLLIDYVGRSGDARGELNSPTHISYADGRLYVVDTLNSRVQVFDSDGRVLNVFGERGLYVGNLARPKGIAVDASGNIYVVEGLYDHLLVFDRDGHFLLPIGGTGKAPGQFYLPAGVWTDARSRVYVADMFNGRVSIFQFLGGS